MVNTDSQTETYELQKELEQNITGEVRFDQMSKTIYSTDASIYQIAPIGPLRSYETLTACMCMPSRPIFLSSAI